MKVLLLIYHLILQITIIHASNQYLGCFIDQIGNRDLNIFIGDYERLTPKHCILACREQNFRYAAIQYGNECRCGQQYGKHGQVSNDECDYLCPTSEKCGGDYRNSVYNVVNSIDHLNTGFICQNNLVGYQGCFDSITLTIEMDIVNSIEQCIKHCVVKYIYAGIMNGNLCYCGNKINFPSVNSNLCNIRCNQNSNGCCGGRYVLSIYNAKISQSSLLSEKIFRVKRAAANDSTDATGVSSASTIISQTLITTSSSLLNSSTTISQPISSMPSTINDISTAVYSSLMMSNVTSTTPISSTYTAGMLITTSNLSTSTIPTMTDTSLLVTIIPNSTSSISVSQSSTNSMSTAGNSSMYSVTSGTGIFSSFQTDTSQAITNTVTAVSSQSSSYRNISYETSIGTASSLNTISSQIYSYTNTTISTNPISSISNTLSVTLSSIYVDTTQSVTSSNTTVVTSNSDIQSTSSINNGTSLTSTMISVPISSEFASTASTHLSQTSTVSNTLNPISSSNVVPNNSSNFSTTESPSTSSITSTYSSQVTSTISQQNNSQTSIPNTSFLSTNSLASNSTNIGIQPTTVSSFRTDITVQTTVSTTSTSSTTTTVSTTSTSSTTTTVTTTSTSSTTTTVSTTSTSSTTTTVSTTSTSSTTTTVSTTSTSFTTTTVTNATIPSTATTIQIVNSTSQITVTTQTVNSTSQTTTTSPSYVISTVIIVPLSENFSSNDNATRETIRRRLIDIVNLAFRCLTDSSYPNCTQSRRLNKRQLCTSGYGVDLVSAITELSQTTSSQRFLVEYIVNNPCNQNAFISPVQVRTATDTLSRTQIRRMLGYNYEGDLIRSTTIGNTDNSTADRKLWIIGAVLGPVGFALLLILVFCYLHYKCRPRPINRTLAKVISTAPPTSARATNYQTVSNEKPTVEKNIHVLTQNDLLVGASTSSRRLTPIESEKRSNVLPEYRISHEIPMDEIRRQNDVERWRNKLRLQEKFQQSSIGFQDPPIPNTNRPFEYDPSHINIQPTNEIISSHSPRPMPKTTDIEAGRTKLHHLLDEVLDKASSEETYNPDSDFERQKRRRQRRRINSISGDQNIVPLSQQIPHIPVIPQVYERPDPSLVRLRYNHYEAGDRAHDISRLPPVQLTPKYTTDDQRSNQYSSRSNPPLFYDDSTIADRAATATDAYANPKRLAKTRLETDREAVIRHDGGRIEQRQHKFNDDAVYIDSISKNQDGYRVQARTAWVEPETDNNSLGKNDYIMAKRSVANTRNIISSIHDELKHISVPSSENYHA